MEPQTIGQVAKAHRITSRMLRYYEQIGLLHSRRSENGAYRVYDDDALRRIRQIVLLRKLQIPVKRIGDILDNPDARAAIDVFRENIAHLDREISALSLIRSVLEGLVTEIERLCGVEMRLDLFEGDALLRLTESLSLVQRNVREKFDMGDLTKAADALNRLRHVRVVYLPPMTVASIVCRGEGARDRAHEALRDVVMRMDLRAAKPDFRVFQFEHDDANGQDIGGFELWVSLPDDAVPPEPFARKRFLGGQYAAHARGESAFETWLGLQDWVNESERYRFDAGLDRVDPPLPELDAFGGRNLNLEELLNVQGAPDPDAQTDLLLPVRDYERGADAAMVDIPGARDACGYAARITSRDKFRIVGFTRIMTADAGGPGAFEAELARDGRRDLLRRCARPGAPLLGYGSMDMDSQIRGGWRWTVCLFESDVADAEALLAGDPYIETIDASRWVIFEYPKGAAFDDHAVCRRLGYTWNGVISGSLLATPEEGDVAHCWYPVK